MCCVHNISIVACAILETPNLVNELLNNDNYLDK